MNTVMVRSRWPGSFGFDANSWTQNVLYDVASNVPAHVGAAVAGSNRSGIEPNGIPRNLLTVAVEDANVVVVPVSGPVSTVADGLAACLTSKGVAPAMVAADKSVTAWSFMASVIFEDAKDLDTGWFAVEQLSFSGHCFICTFKAASPLGFLL